MAAESGWKSKHREGATAADALLPFTLFSLLHRRLLTGRRVLPGRVDSMRAEAAGVPGTVPERTGHGGAPDPAEDTPSTKRVLVRPRTGLHTASEDAEPSIHLGLPARSHQPAWKTSESTGHCGDDSKLSGK